MAKVSRDSSSWKAHGLAKKYEDWENDPKHTPASGKSKKNTKRWCRGKEGKEHSWVSHKPYNFMAYRIVKCSVCGKKDWSAKLPDI